MKSLNREQKAVTPWWPSLMIAVPTLPIDLIMAAYIKQNDFLFGYNNRQSNSIAIGKANGLNPF